MKIITEKRTIEIESPTNVIVYQNVMNEIFIYIDGNWEKLIKIEYTKKNDKK